jgi:hypothetical protein
VPILAPSVGQLIILVGTWRWLFVVLLGSSLTSLIWSWSRLPETRPLATRTRRRTIGEALALVLSNRVTFGYGVASSFVFGFLVAYIASSQQVFGIGYGLGKLFPFAFGSVACAARSGLVHQLPAGPAPRHAAAVSHRAGRACRPQRSTGRAQRYIPPAAWLEMLKQIAPSIRRVTLIFNPNTTPFYPTFLRELGGAPALLAVEVSASPVHDEAQTEATITAFGA